MSANLYRVMLCGSIAAFIILVLGIFSVLPPKTALILFAFWALVGRAYDFWKQWSNSDALSSSDARAPSVEEGKHG